MPHDDSQHDVRLTLRAVPGWHGPPLVRLRRAMKCLLRSFGWRMVAVENLPDETPAAKEGMTYTSPITTKENNRA